MANYSITDPLSLTVRYSNTETTSATAANVCDINRFTVSQLTWLQIILAFLAEYSDISGTDNDFIGLELIYTF